MDLSISPSVELDIVIEMDIDYLTKTEFLLPQAWELNLTSEF